MLEFSSNYFDCHRDNFGRCAKELLHVNSILEIGSYEGRASCWMLENMLPESGVLTCVDHFYCALNIEERFRNNINQVKKPAQKVEILVDPSYYALGCLIAQKRLYDFIYVDADHSATGALTDAVMAFRLLEPGGIMLFDDYMFNEVSNHHDRPKMSLDAFVNMFINEIEVIFVNYQLAIRKKVKMNTDIQRVIEAIQPRVTDEWFEQGAFPTFKHPTPISYETAAESGTVETLEGPVNYLAGHKIITGPKGEKYPVTPIKFAAYYDDNGDGTATPKKIMKVAKLADHDGVLHTSWGNLNYSKGQDYIVKHGPGDFGAVKADIFAKTYDTSKL